jgi:hypothetical protein
LETNDDDEEAKEDSFGHGGDETLMRALRML